MERSLSKIINTFRTWAGTHAQIETFESKPLTEFIAKDQRRYPLMWLDYSAIAPSASYGIWTVTMPIYFFDRVERDYSNIDQVMSSMLLLVDDFLTEFNDNHCNIGFDIDYSAGVSPWMLEFEDIVCGWQVSASIKTGFNRDETKIPKR